MPSRKYLTDAHYASTPSREHVQQLIAILSGYYDTATGLGFAVKLTGYDGDEPGGFSTNYALSVRNRDLTGSRAFEVLSGDGLTKVLDVSGNVAKSVTSLGVVSTSTQVIVNGTTAGGDLTGTYPNPTFAPGSIPPIGSIQPWWGNNTSAGWAHIRGLGAAAGDTTKHYALCDGGTYSTVVTPNLNSATSGRFVSGPVAGAISFTSGISYGNSGGTINVAHDHAHTHTLVHTHTIAHTHTLVHTHTLAHTHTLVHDHSITHIHDITHNHTLAHTHPMAHTHTLIHTHPMAHTHTINHDHTHVHTHTIAHTHDGGTLAYVHVHAAGTLSFVHVHNVSGFVDNNTDTEDGGGSGNLKAADGHRHSILVESQGVKAGSSWTGETAGASTTSWTGATAGASTGTSGPENPSSTSTSTVATSASSAPNTGNESTATTSGSSAPDTGGVSTPDTGGSSAPNTGGSSPGTSGAASPSATTSGASVETTSAASVATTSGASVETTSASSAPDSGPASTSTTSSNSAASQLSSTQDIRPETLAMYWIIRVL